MKGGDTMEKSSSIQQRNTLVLEVRAAVDAILAKHMELGGITTGDVDPSTSCKLSCAIEDIGAALQHILLTNK